MSIGNAVTRPTMVAASASRFLAGDVGTPGGALPGGKAGAKGGAPDAPVGELAATVVTVMKVFWASAAVVTACTAAARTDSEL